MTTMRLSFGPCFTVIAMMAFANFDAVKSDCSTYTNISDPWRNVGFCSTGVNKSDSDLTAGWYRFSGSAGDVLMSSCLYAANNTHPDKYNVFSCNSTFIQFYTCSQGFTIFYLRPSQGFYTARHSSCSNSSCGSNAHCGTVYGSCVCDPGLTYSTDYGCSVIQTSDDCQTVDCGLDFLTTLDNLLNRTGHLSQTMVENYLTAVMNLTLIPYPLDDAQLILLGNTFLNVAEKLVSLMVTPTDTNRTVSIKLSDMEAQIFTVGKNTLLKDIPVLNSGKAFLNIDLIGIAKENNGSGSVVFISYTSMANILKPSLFNTNTSATKTMMSTVVSATLPKINSTSLRTPVNFTFQHLQKLVEAANVSCVYWKQSHWEEDGCSIGMRNITHTMCSCTHLTTFALIMMIDPDKVSEDDVLLSVLCVSVGLLFLVLTILSLAVFQRGQKMSNVALLNLSISLLLAHLTHLLTQQNLENVKKSQMCRQLAGVVHFLFLSAFLWMFIEAVLLYIYVKNLSRICSSQREVLNWQFLIVIGYIIPMFMVAVTAGLYPEAYDEKQCWLSKQFTWSFLGPVACILAINFLLSCVIVENLRRALKSLDKSVSRLKHTRTLVLKTLLQFVILGCTWAIGFFVDKNDMINKIFIVLNSQQGTFIFIVHCVLNQEIRQQCRKYWMGLRHKYMPQNRTRTSSRSTIN